METIDDIVKEMRERAASDDAGQFEANKLHRLADRIEKAENHGYHALQVHLKKLEAECENELAEKSRIIAELNEVRELNRKCCDENERLHAAIQHVLDIVMDEQTSDLSMELAINEAKRIYNESMKGKNNE